jgi:hypothetical protein
MKKRSYYVVLETDSRVISNIVETHNDLDTVNGLRDEIADLSEPYGQNIIILNWKRLKKHWWSK